MKVLNLVDPPLYCPGETFPGWTQWTDWTCSEPCNEGFIGRTRYCSNLASVRFKNTKNPSLLLFINMWSEGKPIRGPTLHGFIRWWLNGWNVTGVLLPWDMSRWLQVLFYCSSRKTNKSCYLIIFILSVPVYSFHYDVTLLSSKWSSQVAGLGWGTYLFFQKNGHITFSIDKVIRAINIVPFWALLSAMPSIMMRPMMSASLDI